MKSLSCAFWTTLLATLLLAGSAVAAGPTGQALATVQTDAGSIVWQSPAAAQLRIIGPKDFVFNRNLEAGETYLFAASNKLVDGSYTWSLTPAVHVKRSESAASATRGLGEMKKFDSQSGYFTVSGGAFIVGGTEATPEKDQQFLDDVIVVGSLCAGLDCANGESFGFDTLRLKENNLRIHFQDTSTSASFPSTDWRLLANETSNGGKNLFAIEDSTAGRRPFTVEGGAPADSLYVEDGGRIGLGTKTPVVELHIQNGDTPTLRLEQDGSSGFTPQTYDVASNEANFFIRDVTNGSKLVMKIKPGAPTSSIFVAASGNIGFGTESPDSNLDIEAPLPELRLTGTDATPTQAWEMRINNAGNLNFQDANTTFTPVQIGPGAINNLLQIGRNNTDQVDINGNLVISGSCDDGAAGGTGDRCDGVFKPDYPLESLEEHAAFMWENSYLPGVGPTPVDAPWNIADKSAGMLNELEKAHIYIEQLHSSIKALENRLAKLEAEDEASE